MIIKNEKIKTTPPLNFWHPVLGGGAVNDDATIKKAKNYNPQKFKCSASYKSA